MDGEDLDRIVDEIKRVGDERKILHDADIVEIAERVTGRIIDIFPKDINAIVMIAVESHVYTGAVVRRLKNAQRGFQRVRDHRRLRYQPVCATCRTPAI